MWAQPSSRARMWKSLYRGPLLKRFVLIVSALLAVPVVLSGLLAIDIWYANAHKSVVQVLESGNGSGKFILMTDLSGAGDQAWYAYRTDVDEEPTDEMQAGRSKDGALFWSYSETGDHASDAKIEIFGDMYLVFSRGGLFHSLYDLESRRVLINETTPWAAFVREIGYETGRSGGSRDETRYPFHKWKVETLHKPILRVLSPGSKGS